MSRRSDELFDIIEGDDMDDGLAAFVAELRGLARGPVPEPSAELAMLLGRRRPTALRRRPTRSLLGAVAASVIIVLGGAASQHALPEPAQSVVSHVVDRLTPFGLGALQHPGRTWPAPTPRSMHHVGAPATPIVATHSRPKRSAKSTPPAGGPVLAAAAHPTVGHLAQPARFARGHPGLRPTRHRPWPHQRWPHHQVSRRHWGHHLGAHHPHWSHRGAHGWNHHGSHHGGWHRRGPRHP